jgi:3-deoxy-7-phosphoheptulonate synthase
MIIVKKSNIPNNFIGKSIGEVGEWYCFPDEFASELKGIDIRCVPDDIKFPLAFRQPGEGNREGWLSSFDVIAGPCSAEDEVQVYETAKFLSSLGVKYFRAGNFKPRTNAYSFQGLGLDGLVLCRKVCDEFGMKFVSEVKDATNVEAVAEYADVVQVGSKCMYDVGVLSMLGKTRKNVLLKRHFGATLKEFVQAADFIMCQGNESVILCERGIRTFESSTRFSLDSCGIEWLKKNSNLKIIGDPSHAMGFSYGVSSLANALTAQMVDGLIIEVHPNPPLAKSDASQQLTYNEFAVVYKNVLELNSFMKNQISGKD